MGGHNRPCQSPSCLQRPPRPPHSCQPALPTGRQADRPVSDTQTHQNADRLRGTQTDKHMLIHTTMALPPGTHLHCPASHPSAGDFGAACHAQRCHPASRLEDSKRVHGRRRQRKAGRSGSGQGDDVLPERGGGNRCWFAPSQHHSAPLGR